MAGLVRRDDAEIIMKDEATDELCGAGTYTSEINEALNLQE